MMACKKESAIENLGSASNSGYNAELRVSLSTRAPALYDTVIVTASTWQKNDKIAKVEFLKTMIEKFGVTLELENTTIETWDDTAPLLIVTDTASKEEAFRTINNDELNNFFVTASNNYVIRTEFVDFKPFVGTYPANGAELLRQLPNEAFEILKSQLTFYIGVADYEKLFPSAPNDHYTMSGSSRTGISTVGKTYLKSNLTRQNLIDNGLKSITKIGTLTAIVTIKVTTEGGAVVTSQSSFSSTY